MKRLVFFTLMLVVQNNFILAQSDASNFTMGSKGGFGKSYLSPYSNTLFQPSWDIGVIMAYEPGQHLAFELGGIFSSEGVKFQSGATESSIKLEYLRIPLKLVYLFGGKENIFRPKIAAGPGYGMLLNPENAEGYATSDIALHATVGANIRMLPSFWLTIEGNYLHGLKDIYAANSAKDGNRNLRVDIGLMVGF
jgi:hypothetical protein